MPIIVIEIDVFVLIRDIKLPILSFGVNEKHKKILVCCHFHKN